MLCCVCLLKQPNNMNIFDDKGQQLKVAEIINKYLWFKPTPDNVLTKQICTICWHKIDDFHIFYENVRKAHKEHDERASCSVKTEELNSSSIKEEDECIDDYLDTTNCLETISTDNGVKNPLEESDSNDIPFQLESDDAEDSEISDEYEPSISSDQESLVGEYVHDDTQTSTTNDKDVKRKARRKRNTKAGDSKMNANKKKKKIIHRLDPIHTEDMIRKHIPMGCHLCVYVGTTFADIVEHFKSAHPNIRPFIMCCDKKLTRRFFVAQHALKHENPDCFRCEECSKSFTSTSGLRTHNLTYHANSEDLIYPCDICPKKFARRNLLEYHKTSHIPKDEWKFNCNLCPDNRIFASAYLLNVHTSLRHKREANICPVCAKKIRDKKSYEKHVRLHYEDSGPRVKCPYPDCESWLKDEDNLKQHLRRHNPEGILYKCDECGKECKNRRAVTTHKRYAHSNETFQCEQCDKTFKKAISLREHMAQHTGETLYKCPFCTRTFNSNANMHAHKKKQHPLEWEEWRKNKRGSSQKLINSTNPLNQFDDTSTDINATLYSL